MNRAGNPLSSAVIETHVPRQTDDGLKLYLSPAEFIDSDHDRIGAKAAQIVGSVANVKNHLASLDRSRRRRRVRLPRLCRAHAGANLAATGLDQGEPDALPQPFDADGRAFMTYVARHGTLFDVPAKLSMGEMARLHPKLCRPGGLRGIGMEVESTKR